LALLEIYRDGVVTFDQPTPLGELYVRWIGDDDVNVESMREIDEFDTTEVQDFRSQLGDVEASEELDEDTNEELDGDELEEELIDETGEEPNE
jgi:segregation and condensation protein A